MRECGKCSLCCKLLGIAELNKPMGQWCTYCQPGKCLIYDTRPDECKRFNCLWLKGYLPKELSPLDIHCVAWVTTDNGTKENVTLKIMEDYGHQHNAEKFLWPWILALSTECYNIEIHTGSKLRAVNSMRIPRPT